MDYSIYDALEAGFNKIVFIIRKDLEKAGTMSNMKERAHFCYDEMVPAMNRLREPADRLEMIVDKEYWPFPSYGDMIFEV